MGDVLAISIGCPEKVAKGAARRITGRATGRAMRRLFK